MTLFPITVVDNFLEDPDSLADYAEGLDFNYGSQSYPGLRSEYLHKISPDLYAYISNKILSVFYQKDPVYKIDMQFQKINPFSEDKWNVKNKGWIHQDKSALFGGVLYLTKDPDPDAGTSMYSKKSEYSLFSKQDDLLKAKEKLYTEEFNSFTMPFYEKKEMDEDSFEKIYNAYNDRYEETLRVKNVYNRLLLFDGQQYHGVRTYGDRERLTIAFFAETVAEAGAYPLRRV